MENTLSSSVMIFPIKTSISSGFPIATFDYRRVCIQANMMVIRYHTTKYKGFVGMVCLFCFFIREKRNYQVAPNSSLSWWKKSIIYLGFYAGYIYGKTGHYKANYNWVPPHRKIIVNLNRFLYFWVFLLVSKLGSSWKLGVELLFDLDWIIQKLDFSWATEFFHPKTGRQIIMIIPESPTMPSESRKTSQYPPPNIQKCGSFCFCFNPTCFVIVLNGWFNHPSRGNKPDGLLLGGFMD